MNLKIGLVGLPNVGKSTLFNTLTQSEIPAENYPFCTIDPHTAITIVPDERIEKLQKIYGSRKTIPAYVEFVDIAGLVKGASKGEGLGNQFLANIREVSLIIHVLRCFDDESVINTQKTVDPVRDYETILFEFAQKDLESILLRIQKIEHQIKKTKIAQEINTLEEEKENIIALINSIENLEFNNAKLISQEPCLAHLNLLLAKKIMIVANISDNDLLDLDNQQYIASLKKYFLKETIIPLCIKLENELQKIENKEERKFFQEEYQLKNEGITTIIQESYKKLDLISFFTCGPQEIHNWTIKTNTPIKEAAGEIHSDLSRGFISATVISYSDIRQYNSELGVKNEGKIKTVGAPYIVEDGDIIHVNFNV